MGKCIYSNASLQYCPLFLRPISEFHLRKKLHFIEHEGVNARFEDVAFFTERAAEDHYDTD